MMPTSIGGANVAIHIIADSSKYIKALFRAETLTKKVGTSIQASFFIATAAIAGLGTAAARVGSEFQLQLKLTAVVAGATANQFKLLEQRARQIGRTTAYTSGQAAAGMYGFASAGFKANEILQAVGHSLNLAGAFAHDMYETTNMVASAIRMFGYEASQTQRIVDAYSQGITNSLLTMEKLNYAMSYAGPIAAGFRMSVEETVLALEQFADIGLEGTRIGVAFRMMMKAASKATLEKTMALRKYGLTMRDINPAAIKFIGIIRKVAEVSMSVSDAMKVFGARVGAFVVAIANLAKAGILDWDKELQDFALSLGKTEKIYSQMMATFKMQVVQVQSVIQDLLIAVFQKFEGQVIETFDHLKANINALTAEVQANGGMIKRLAGWFDLLVIGIGKTIRSIGQLVGMMESFIKAVGLAVGITIGGKLLGLFTSWVLWGRKLGGIFVSLTTALKSFNMQAAIGSALMGNWVVVVGAIVTALGFYYFEASRLKDEIALLNEEWERFLTSEGSERMNSLGLPIEQVRLAAERANRSLQSLQEAKFKAFKPFVSGEQRAEMKRVEVLRREWEGVTNVLHAAEQQWPKHVNRLKALTNQLGATGTELDKFVAGMSNKEAQQAISPLVGQIKEIVEAGGDLSDINLDENFIARWNENMIKALDPKWREEYRLIGTYINEIASETSKLLLLDEQITQLTIARSNALDDISGFVGRQVTNTSSMLVEGPLADFIQLLEEEKTKKSINTINQINKLVEDRLTNLAELTKQIEKAQDTGFTNIDINKLLWTSDDIMRDLDKVMEEAGGFGAAAQRKAERVIGEIYDELENSERKRFEKSTKRKLNQLLEYNLKAGTIEKAQAEIMAAWDAKKYQENLDKYHIALAKATKSDLELQLTAIKIEADAFAKALDDKEAGVTLFNARVHKLMQSNLKEITALGEEAEKTIATANINEYSQKLNELSFSYEKNTKAVKKQQEALISIKEDYKNFNEEYAKTVDIQKKLDEAYLIDRQQLYMDAYNEQVEDWNDAIDKMADDFKNIFIQGTTGEWKGWADYWESVLENMRSTFLNWILTLISDWAFGLLKMKALSAGAGLVGGLMGVGAGGAGGAAGSVAKSAGTSLAGSALSKGGMMVLSNGATGKFLPILASKIPGIGSLLTTTGASSIGAFGGTTGMGAAGGAGYFGGPTSAYGPAFNSGTVGWAPGVGAGFIGGGIGGIAGGLIGSNYGQSHGKAAGVGMGAGTGGVMGAAASMALAGSVVPGIGTLIGFIVGAIAGAIGGGAFGADPLKRKRQARGREYGESVRAWGEGEYSSLGQMFGAVNENIFDPKYLYAAMNYLGDMPDTGMAYSLQESMGNMNQIYKQLGGLSKAVGAQMGIANIQLELMNREIQEEFPENAKQAEELAIKMNELFAQDLIKQFTMGLMSLRNLRSELQDLGMEDAEMMSTELDAVLQRLFNNTLPMGEVQLERLYGEVKNLKDDMEEAERQTEGFNTLLTMMGDGVEFTGKQLEYFRSNVDNLAMLDDIDLYYEMGMDKLELAPPTVEDTEDAIRSLRAGVDQVDASLEQFTYYVEKLPSNLSGLKKALNEVINVFSMLNSIIDEFADAAEFLDNWDELLAEMQEALDAGDLVAYADNLGEVASGLMDIVETTQLVYQTFDSLGKAASSFDWMGMLLENSDDIYEAFAKIAAMGPGWAKSMDRLQNGLHFIGAIGQGIAKGFGVFTEVVFVISLVVELIQMFTYLGESIKNVQKAWVDTLNIFAENRGLDYSPWVEWIYWMRSQFILLGKELRNNLVEGWGDDWYERVGAGRQDRLDEIYGKGEYANPEQEFIDLEDLYWQLGKISKETFDSLTMDIYRYTENVGKSAAELEAHALGLDYARYLQYLGENWDDLVERFGGGSTGQAIVQEMMDNSVAYFENALEEIVENAISAWEDFLDQLNDTMGELESERLKYQSIADGGSEEMGDYIYNQNEKLRYDAKALEAWTKYASEEDPEKKLEYAQEVADYLQSAHDAHIGMIQAEYDEQERLIRERYETENDAIQQIIDLYERKEDFTKGIQDLIDEIRGSGGSAGFNQARADITRLKGEFATATGQDKLDIADDLKDAYERLWRSGSDMYEEDWKAYGLLQEEAIAGLTELMTLGGEAYDTEIQALRDIHDIQGNIEQIQQDIEDNTDNLEEELRNLRTIEAQAIADAIADYQTYLEGLEVDVDVQTDGIRTAIEQGFLDAIGQFGTYLNLEMPVPMSIEDLQPYLNAIITALEGDPVDGGDGTDDREDRIYRTAYNLDEAKASSDYWNMLVGEIDSMPEAFAAILAVAQDYQAAGETGYAMDLWEDMGPLFNWMEANNWSNMDQLPIDLQDELQRLINEFGRIDSADALQGFYDAFEEGGLELEGDIVTWLQNWLNSIQPPPPPPDNEYPYEWVPYGMSTQATDDWDRIYQDISTLTEGIIAIGSTMEDVDWRDLSGNELSTALDMQNFLQGAFGLNNIEWTDPNVVENLLGARANFDDTELVDFFNRFMVRSSDDAINGLAAMEYYLEEVLGYSTRIYDDLYSALGQIVADITFGEMHTGGFTSSGLYNLEAGEVFSPRASGMYGFEALADKIVGAMQSKTQTKSKEKVFVFVPYNTSPQEQERIYQEVKSRIREDSENEQFIYDNALIRTNRGL